LLVSKDYQKVQINQGASVIILGIDPGTATTGYGVIERSGSRIKFLDCGVIITAKSLPMPERLLAIYTKLNIVLDNHRPDSIGTEQLFFSNNVTTAMNVGAAVGVVLLAAAQRSIPIFEYRPAEVKMAVVGYGAAEKKQVQYMVKNLLSLDKLPKPDDAADALAIAICHAHSVRE
jgi:crossover junction endodeoxyribonuclease RuvC